MLIEIKNWYTRKAIFSLDVEDNSIKRTVEEAVKQGVDLSYADLDCADLRSADLRCADLRSADLRCANLNGANLHCANLNGACFSNANLRSANLTGACLSGSNFRCAYLGDACLRSADLRSAYLSNADLRDACLSSADIHGANLSYSCIIDAKNIPDLPMICPREGSFIGWKKIRSYKESYEGDFIVKLEIPEDAKRSSAAGNKCRCSKAKVLEIKSVVTDECIDVITNTNMVECVYKVGEYVYPDSFDSNRWNECSNGIHFFMTEEEVRNY